MQVQAKRSRARIFLRAFLPPLGVALVALALWAALVLYGTLEGWGRAAPPPGDTRAFIAAAHARVASEQRGNAVLRVIHAGRVADEYTASVGAPVDGSTLFQVASLSKWVTAIGVLTLVDAGKLDLDRPVASYLTRWSLPESGFDIREVTIRRLLSHTAGLTDGLGYAGFPPGTPTQALEASLTRAADASPGADGRVRVGVPPGSEWRYSGGGYTLLQLVIEEVAGEPFNAYMQRAVLRPLGMARSTFVVDARTPNVATIYGTDGKPATRYRFTALAAASLYTSAEDLTHLVQAHFPGPNGEPPGRGVLRPATLRAMRAPQATLMGADIWGLGTILYVPNGRGDFIIGHDGNNAPAINTAVRLNPANGDGIIVLETGNPRLATQVAGDWTFWQAGAIDLLDLQMAANTLLAVIAGGGLAIAAAALAVGTRRLRRARAHAD